MKIFRAVKRNFRSQAFGENKVDFYKNMNPPMLGHGGWDWVIDRGNPVYWDCNIRGKVIETHTDGTGGLGVIVVTEDEDGIFKHRFWHFLEVKCQVGDILDSGDLLGLGDSTGKYTTGHHLHRDLKPAYLDENDNYQTKNWSPDYRGAIDIEPYFKSIFILDHIKFLVARISMLQVILNALKVLFRIRLMIKK